MSAATFTIQLISASATYSVRNIVLRPGRPVKECHFLGDESKGTFHLGLFKGEHIVGVASFMTNSNPFFDPNIQYQLRGMAVLPEYIGQGLGTLLLKEGESKIKQESKDAFIWFNARVSAINFYKKHGYKSFGKKFEVPGVCEHIVMFKHFDSKNK